MSDTCKFDRDERYFDCSGNKYMKIPAGVFPTGGGPYSVLAKLKMKNADWKGAFCFGSESDNKKIALYRNSNDVAKISRGGSTVDTTLTNTFVDEDTVVLTYDGIVSS